MAAATPAVLTPRLCACFHNTSQLAPPTHTVMRTHTHSHTHTVTHTHTHARARLFPPQQLSGRRSTLGDREPPSRSQSQANLSVQQSPGALNRQLAALASACNSNAPSHPGSHDGGSHVCGSQYRGASVVNGGQAPGPALSVAESMWPEELLKVCVCVCGGGGGGGGGCGLQLLPPSPTPHPSLLLGLYTPLTHSPIAVPWGPRARIEYLALITSSLTPQSLTLPSSHPSTRLLNATHTCPLPSHGTFWTLGRTASPMWSTYAFAPPPPSLSLSLSVSLTHTQSHTHTHTAGPCGPRARWCSSYGAPVGLLVPQDRGPLRHVHVVEQGGGWTPDHCNQGRLSITVYGISLHGFTAPSTQCHLHAVEQGGGGSWQLTL